MAVRNSRSAASDHRRHDRLLVARFAVGDAEFGHEREAKELIRHCSECAALAADISAISKTVAKMPAPRRTRDFRLTPEQADKLRGSGLERFFRAISGSGWTIARPVAGVALSIGLVMSVVGFLPTLGGGAASGPTSDLEQVVAGAPTPGGQIPLQPTTMAGAPAEGSSRDTVADGLSNAYLDEKTEAPADHAARPPLPAVRETGVDSRDLLFIGGLALSVLALAGLALIYAARRRFTDPLLR
jgi:hypothetical protein